MFSNFHHLQKDKQRKQRHSLCKLGKKRRESSKRNYYIVSPRVIIKAIIIILQCVAVCCRVFECEDCFYYCPERNNVVVLFGTLQAQSFILTEVSGCGLLIVVISSID